MLESTQELLEDEILKYRVLANEGIITEEEFSVKEEELLYFIKKNNKIKKYKGNI